MLLLAAMVLPAVILVAVLVQARKVLDLDEQLVSYSSYSSVLMLVITVFAASQAPALISRDLRFRTITLYLARPLRRSTYVLVRLASLAAAIFLLVAAPLAGDVRRRAARRPAVGRPDQAVPGRPGGRAAAGPGPGRVSGLVSALTTRRGLAVAAVIVVVLVTFVVATSVIAIAEDLGREQVAALGGLLSPFTLVDGLQSWALGTEPASGETEIGTGAGLLYLAVTHPPGRRLGGRDAAALPQGGRRHDEHRADPRLAVVPQRGRGQRHHDDDRTRRDRAARDPTARASRR